MGEYELGIEVYLTPNPSLRASFFEAK